jgi:uncharacterized protein YdhG (YjbR/CyaY superfamily)
MAMPRTHFENIDDYIAQCPPEVRERLQELRRVIHEAAPEATEAISYQMPTFKLNGNLVHFAAFKNHIGFYPAPSGIEAFRDRLDPYIGGKGTVKFALDQPIPYDLVADIVVYRVQESLAQQKK